jgi:hypothetical protein
MPINIKRPNSALLRGVQITEFKGHIINPDPIILQETDFLLEEFLSPTKLVNIILILLLVKNKVSKITI